MAIFYNHNIIHTLLFSAFLVNFIQETKCCETMIFVHVNKNISNIYDIDKLII